MDQRLQPGDDDESSWRGWGYRHDGIVVDVNEDGWLGDINVNKRQQRQRVGHGRENRHRHWVRRGRPAHRRRGAPRAPRPEAEEEAGGAERRAERPGPALRASAASFR